MILDLILGKNGFARAWIMRGLIALALTGLFMMYKAFGRIVLNESGSSILDMVWVSNWVLFFVMLSTMIAFFTRMFHFDEEKAAKYQGKEPNKYPWSYMISMGLDKEGKDIGSYRIESEYSEEEILLSLKQLAERGTTVAHWDILLKQDAVKKIPEARKLCITQRKRQLEKDRVGVSQKSPSPIELIKYPTPRNGVTG